MKVENLSVCTRCSEVVEKYFTDECPACKASWKEFLSLSIFIKEEALRSYSIWMRERLDGKKVA